MKVKDKSARVGLKLNIQKTKIMAFGPFTSWKIDGETIKTVTDFILGEAQITDTVLFILFMGFSRQEYWSGLPFPSPVDHILSELSTMTRPSWVTLHGMVHSFTEFNKAVIHVIRLVSFLWLWFSVCLTSDGEG